jgi:hypothetical protein
MSGSTGGYYPNQRRQRDEVKYSKNEIDGTCLELTDKNVILSVIEKPNYTSENMPFGATGATGSIFGGTMKANEKLLMGINNTDNPLDNGAATAYPDPGSNTYVPRGVGYIQFSDGTRMFTKPTSNSGGSGSSTFAYEPFSHSAPGEKKFNLGSENNDPNIHCTQFYAKTTGKYRYALLHGANDEENINIIGNIGVAIYSNDEDTSDPRPKLRLGGGVLNIPAEEPIN